MKNKTILALAIASTLGLTGCGDEKSELRIDDTIKDSLNRQSSIAFDLISSEKVIPTPTYLVMDTSDGTLNIPLAAGADPTDRSNPAVAMGDTDGWSPTQPFVIELDLPAGVTLTTDTTLLQAAVKVVKVTVSGTKEFSLEDQNDILTAGVDYTVFLTGSSLAVLPLNGSLEHGSDYIYAITDALVDSSGEKLGMSTSYAALKNKQIDQTGGSLETPQTIVLNAEKLMDDQGIADYENIIYSSWFSTSSAGSALYYTKVVTALALSQAGNGNAVWPVNSYTLPDGKNLQNLYSVKDTELVTPVVPGAGDADTPTIAYLAAGVASTLTVHTGTIKLPSFLERDPTLFSSTPWQSAIPSLAILKGIATDEDPEELVHLMTTQGFDPLSLANPLSLIGKSFKKIDGSAVDGERLITKYSMFPQVKDVDDVKFLLITPKKDKDGNDVDANHPVPLVIYQHGITSVKENILASGDALFKGYAILAIDLPLHGERGILNDFGDSDPANDEYYVADSDNADVFMNFGYLAVGRDNMRQAVADLIGLRAGLSITTDTKFDVIDKSNVSFFGHSLGAMTGISLQATLEKALPDALSGLESMFTIDKAVFANPGGGVPYLLLNSDEFGGTVKQGLMLGSDTPLVQETSNGYTAFKQGNCGDNLPLKNDTACFNGYYDYIETVKPGTQAVIDATFRSFAVAAQTVLETADPFAVARNISADTPIYLAQVSGDTVIPNYLVPNAGYAAPYSPIGGTEPLMSQLKLKNVYTFTDTTKKTALLLAGEHSSVIVDYTTDPVDVDHPNANTATTNELQNHIANFLAGNGSTIGTVTTSLLDPKVIPSLE